jgi:hypothetical protein
VATLLNRWRLGFHKIRGYSWPAQLSSVSAKTSLLHCVHQLISQLHNDRSLSGLVTARPVLGVALLYACDQECTDAKRLDARTPGRSNFKRWSLIFFIIITALFFLTYKNVYELTRTEERAPENVEVQRSLKNCGGPQLGTSLTSFLWRLEFGSGALIFGKKFVHPCLRSSYFWVYTWVGLQILSVRQFWRHAGTHHSDDCSRDHFLCIVVLLYVRLKEVNKKW